MPDTATEEKKPDTEAPKAELTPTETQPEEQKKTNEAEQILHSESGDTAPAQAKAPPVAEAADDGWKTLTEAAKRQGVTPEQMARYAKLGYEAQYAAQAKVAADSQSKGVEQEVDDEEVAPVSRKEFQAQIADMEKRTAVAIAGARNDSKLEALLNTQPLTRDELESRETVARKTYELMAAGASMETAFGEASRRHGDFLARVTKRSTKKKIAAQAALGEGGAGQSVEILPETFKPDADNIRSGKTVERATRYVEQLHAG